MYVQIVVHSPIWAKGSTDGAERGDLNCPAINKCMTQVECNASPALARDITFWRSTWGMSVKINFTQMYRDLKNAQIGAFGSDLRGQGCHGLYRIYFLLMD